LTSAVDAWGALVADCFAGFFCAPLTAESVATYRDGLGAELLCSLAEEPGCVAGVRTMQAALADGTAFAVTHRLALGFTLLFEGVGGPETVSPYESAHLSPTGRLFQGPVGQIDRLLDAWDVSASDSFREPSDHLSIELALLARMMRRPDEEAAQADLLDEHLLAWVPGFADRCTAVAAFSFYAGAAQALPGFLLGHRASLSFQRRAVLCPA
jgi:TorA-specific chaperone